MADRTCTVCGEVLIAPTSRQKFCGTSCKDKDKYARSHPVQEQPCLWCGTVLLTSDTRKLYCSRSCKEKCLYRVQNPPVARYCETCGNSIALEKLATAKFCSRYCKDAAVERNRAKRDPRDRSEYYRSNKVIYANASAKRRTLMVGHVSQRDWLRLLRRYGNKCAYCGTDGSLAMDHVVPVIRGGQHAIGNILPACKSCNSSKNARTLMEWRLGRRWKRSGRRVDALEA